MGRKGFRGRVKAPPEERGGVDPQWDGGGLWVWEGIWGWARAPSSGAGGALGVGWDTPNGWWGRVGGLWEVGVVTTGRRMAENP